MNRLSLILSIILGFSTLVGAVVGVNEYFAKAADVELVSMRLEQKIAQDRCDWIQQRLWQLEDRYCGKELPPSVREEYRKLKYDYDRNCIQMPTTKPREDH